MPIYDYSCGACGHVTEVIHGINDHGPRFCPECGAEGTMRKALSAPAIVFKGSGWAKVDRRASTSASRSTGTSSSKPASGGPKGSTTSGGSTSTSTTSTETSGSGGKAASGDGGGE